MSYQMYDSGGIGMGNQAYANIIPLALLKKAFLPMVRIWDNKWSAELSKVMPKMKGAPNGGSHFSWPIIANPQAISDMHSPYGRTRYFTTGADAESWDTRLTKAGFAMEPEEMLEEFTMEGGLGTSAKMQRLTQICIQAIERRVELELVNYIFGNTLAIQQFSNQKVRRLLRVDTTSGSSGMTGYAWSDMTNSRPYKDISNVVELQSGMGDENLEHFFLGTKTAKMIKNHDQIIDRIKFVRDVSGGALEAFVAGLEGGMQAHVVKAHTYKEASADVGAVGGPGAGDLTPDDWNERNKYWFMRESSYEFAFFTASNLGFTFTSKTCPQHSGEGLYTFQYTENEPHVYKMRFELKFCPGVNDFGNEVVARKICPQSA